MSAKNLVNSILPTLEELENKFKTADQSSRESLYENLKGAMEVVALIEANEAFAGELTQRLKEKEIKVRKDTDIVLRVLKATQTEDRKKANEYAIVLRKAKLLGKKPKDIPTWIKDEGGINEIRRGEKSESDKVSRKDVIVSATQKLDAIVNPLATVIVPNANVASITEKYAVAIVRVGNGESVDVLSVLSDKAAVNAAIYELGKGEMDSAQSDAVSADAQLQSASAAAIESAKVEK